MPVSEKDSQLINRQKIIAMKKPASSQVARAIRAALSSVSHWQHTL
jgi:hypothetical protein